MGVFLSVIARSPHNPYPSLRGAHATHPSLRRARTSPHCHCEEPVFWATKQLLVLGSHSPPHLSLRGRALFALTRQSLVPKVYWRTQKRDCHGAKKQAPRNDNSKWTPFPTMSLRGGTVFVPTKQSLASKVYWEPQKRDCHAPLRGVLNDRGVVCHCEEGRFLP